MQQGKHIAQRAAERVLKAFPESLKWMERYKRDPDLLPGCLIPQSELFDFALAHDGLEASNGIRMLAALHNMLSWRYSPLIYRFDDALYREITETNLGNAIRPEAFLTMPGWGIYIETPGFPMHDEHYKSHGFFASISDESYLQGRGVELRLTFLLRRDGDTPVTLPIPLVDGTVEDCIKAFQDTSSRFLQQNTIASPAAAFAASMSRELNMNVAFAQDLSVCLSLLLYLCSEEPDTLAPRTRPQPQINKRGQRIMPALQPKTWDVGLRFGAAYRAYQRQAGQGDSQGTGSHKRPHLRRAHWHGFWYGPRSEETQREFRLRWIAPTMVGSQMDELPATIHPVKP